MSYMQDDFLLENEAAKRLYADYAADMPIFDYHCHLSEKQILENKPFADLYEIWLAGDHYKWRLMRNFGIDEAYITGEGSHEEKFRAYCKTLGTAFGNPLYHWSQAELQEFFGCDKEINESNADAIWKECNDYIRTHEITPQRLIEQSNVRHLFTTNEVFDDLSVFEKIAQKGYAFSVAPAFRADKIINIEADGYNGFVDKLGKVRDLDALEAKLEERLQAFLRVGARASDIAVQAVYPVADRDTAAKIFARRRANQPTDEESARAFKGYLTYFLCKLYAKYGVCTELHVGAMRNNNTVMLRKLGLDTGYDSVADDYCIQNMSRLFDRLHSENALPKLIVFNLNPKMNTEIMTLLGCFQDATAHGKLQYGAAWWFLDNKQGMEKHLQDLTATGHIGTFVGMLTDSRSFLSYPRHKYFRRILCNYLGTLMQKREITQDMALVGEVVKDVCYRNAVRYFGVRE